MLVHGKQIRNNSIDRDKLTFEPNESFIYTQSSPESTWTINHNLNMHVQITVYDTTNTQIEGQIEEIDINTTIIYFNTNIAGYAVIN